MGRGRKRKAAPKQDEKLKGKVEEEETQEQEQQEVDAEQVEKEEEAPPKKAAKRGKRARISNPAEDEYFEDKRNLVIRCVFLVLVLIYIFLNVSV